MYQPPHSKVDDVTEMHALMRARPFATFISSGNLGLFATQLPTILKPGGTAAIISFHSGEDRLIKAAFRDGLRSGIYEAVAPDAMRPAFDERRENPRSRSAKLRWARRSTV